jgi:prolyl-tRNA synthetase
MSEKLGIGTKRSQDFSQWYLEVVRKGNFIDQRSPVKGFDVILPWGYAVWEMLQHRFDALIKKAGVANAYFPLVIPEHLLKKEEEHMKGFRAETMMITEAGGSRLDEKLAVRPTSETIMYHMFSLWIRSYKDLPLKINQWCNVVRYDTKVTRPFLRGREFLWQEGHTAHASKDEAEGWVQRVVEMYKKVYGAMSIEPLILVRPKSDTFAGADFSVVFDTLVQDGKVAQGPGTHMLGQHFSKAFEITYLDKSGSRQHVWQTSWGLSTRQLGILVSHHGDDKGAMLPPDIAPYQCVIVPILFSGKEEKVIKEGRKVEAKLNDLGLRTYLDDRDYTAGFKFNEWELKGVPLRVEVGPQDIKNKEVTVVKRTDGKRVHVKLTRLNSIKKMLGDIQSELLLKSRKFLRGNIADADTLAKLKEEAKKGGFSRANWCGSAECEKSIKAETGGAEIRGTLYGKEETPFAACVHCGSPAKHVVYIARAY